MGPATRDRRRACAAAALVVLAASGVVAGCRLDDDGRGMGDAPVLNRRGDDAPAEVFNFPDHFGNLATKCVGHGYRAYVTTNKGAPSNIEIVPDPECAASDATPAPSTGSPPAGSPPPATPGGVAGDS